MGRQSTYAYYMGLRARQFQFFDAPTSNCRLSYSINQYTYPQKSTPPFPMAYNNSSGGYYFYMQFQNSNGTAGSVSITYPFSATSTGTVGRGSQLNTNSYPFYTVQTNTNYGYFFSYWSVNYPGGTVWSYTNSTNFWFNDTYYDASSIVNNYT